MTEDPSTADDRRANEGNWRSAAMMQAQEGDGRAYRDLLADVSPLLRRYLAKDLRNGHDIEDVLQETLLALHRGRHSYDPNRPFEPWLFAIARNTKTDFLRRVISRQSWEILVDEQPETQAEERLSDNTLADALEELPESQRKAFQHLKLDGRSVKEAAAIEGVSEGNLRIRAHRAYQTLRGILSR